MTITQIECFIEAAKTGSFGKAGVRLYISQQTISRQIRALEEELGFPLFVRSRAGVSLTESGKVLYEKWKEMMIEFRSSIDKARDAFLGESKRVKIGVVELGHQTETIAQGLIRFNERYPDLEVEYEVRSASDLLFALEGGTCHIIFVPMGDVLHKTDLKIIPLDSFFEEIGIVAAKSHPLARRKRLEFTYLAEELIGVLGREAAPDHLRKVEKQFEKSGVTTPLNVKEYTSVTSLQMALVTGKCVTVMFEYITSGIEDKVCFVPIEADGRDHRIAVAYRDEKYAVKAKNIAREFETES